VQNEETAMSESYHTFHLKKRGTAMKRAVQTLFLLLVLILSFSLVSCDEEETVTTTEEEETTTISSVEKMNMKYQKVIDFQDRKIREELSSKTGAEFEEFVTKLLKGANPSDRYVYVKYSNTNAIAEDRLIAPYYEPTTQKILFYFAVEAYHTNDLDRAQYILTRLLEHREKNKTLYSLNFSGQIKSGLTVSYNLRTLQAAVDQRKEQVAVEKANQKFRSIVDMILSGKKANEGYREYLKITEKDKIEPYTVDGKEYRYESVPDLFYAILLEYSSDLEIWKSLQQGDWIYFGTYEQDNNLENGTEPLLWNVVNRSENTLYLDCYPILRYMQWTAGDYEKDPTLLYWENCPIRTWLNGEFYETAFTQEEKRWIATKKLTNTWYGGMGGADTLDRVFFLSEMETYTSVGHKATEYAKATGKASDYYGENYVWRRDTNYKTYAGFWNGYRGVAPCVQIQIPAA